MKTSKPNKVRINISLSEKAIEISKIKAEFFGGNLSAYITHLILNDAKDIQNAPFARADNSEKNIKSEPIKKSKKD